MLITTHTLKHSIKTVLATLSILLVSFQSIAFEAWLPETFDDRVGLTSTDEGTRVVMLGSGTPNPSTTRFGPSVAIVVGQQPYIVDFGPGVVRRAAAATENGIEGLSVKRLSRAFVTHLHSDHTIGFADLLLSPWVLERDEPLQVFGPEGIKSMARHIKKAYSQDIQMRLFGSEPANNNGHRVIAKEIKEGRIYADDHVIVDAFSVPHGSWPNAFGYRFTSADRVIVVSGDTAYEEKIAKVCNGCDVLVHELYSDSGFDRRNELWQNYHSINHTSATQLGQLATLATPKLLLLYHQLYWGTSDEDMVKEVESKFDGTVISSVDLGVY